MSSDSCSADYGSLMNDQNLYEKAFNTNPDLAKKSIDPGSCKKSNVTASTTTNTKSSTQVTVITGMGGGRGTSKSSTNSTSQYNATSSQGCAAVAAQYALNLAVNNGLNCAVSNTKTDAKTSGRQVQTMTITIEDAVIGGNLKITGNQKSSMSGQIIDFSSQTLQQNMASQVQTQLKNLQSSSQKTSAKKLNFAPTGSQKLFSDAISGAVGSSTSNTTSNVIKNTITDLFQSQGTTIVLKGLNVKGNATIDEMQTEAESFVIKQIAQNVVGSMMTVKAENTSTNTQKSTQSTKVSGRKELKAPPVGGDSKGSSHFVFLLLMLICLVGFSIIKVDPKIRAGCFYVAFLFFVILLILDHSKHKFVLWLSIILFVIGCIVNTKEWTINNDDTKIGGGFSDGILPFPKSGTTVVTLQKNKGQTQKQQQQQSQRNQITKRQSQTRQQQPQVRQQNIYTNKPVTSVHKQMGVNPLRKNQQSQTSKQRQQPQVRQSQVHTNQPVTSVHKQMMMNPMLRKKQSINNMRHRTYTGQTGQVTI
jgi:hypothetical protein